MLSAGPWSARSIKQDNTVTEIVYAPAGVQCNWVLDAIDQWPLTTLYEWDPTKSKAQLGW